VTAIEVRVRDLAQLFHSMDPSPFHDRDLDRDAEAYIVEYAQELGSFEALVIRLDGPAALTDEAAVGAAIHQHFARRAERSRHELRRLLHRGWISLAIGLGCLGAALGGGASIAHWMPAGALTTVLRESVLIGGWVAMWRPMEIFLYDWWELRDQRRVYERLARLPVRLVATGTTSEGWSFERPSAYGVRLLDEARGREIGRIREDELAFLQEALEEEGANDTDYWIDPETLELLARRGASPHLIELLGAALEESPEGLEIAFERADEPRRRKLARGSAG
jgi:hypothetical protein